MFFIQVVCGRPSGRLQFSGGGSKMAWLAAVVPIKLNVIIAVLLVYQQFGSGYHF